MSRASVTSIVRPDMSLEAEIDFSAYYRSHEARTKVLKPSAFIDEVLEEINPDRRSNDPRLPWPKTYHEFRFRSGEVTLWVGVNGHGKSVLTSQVAIRLAAQGQKGGILSFEMKPRKTIYRMLRQASRGDSPSIDYAKKFVGWMDGKVWFYDQSGTVKIDTVLGVVSYMAQELGCDFIVIDSLMKCVKGEEDYDGQKALVDALCSAAREMNLHVHLVHHVRKGLDEKSPPGKMDAKGSGSITDQVDNVLIAWRNKGKEREAERGDVDNAKPDALLICEKQRNGDWEGRWGLWYDKGSMQFTEREKQFPVDLLVGNNGMSPF